MKIKPGFPPNIDEIRAVFPISKHTCFTYGQDLYVQDNEGSDLLLAHEEVHARQQKNPPEWWRQYLQDPQFRLSQEIEAYGAQYQWATQHYGKRICKDILFDLACDLSSELYGRLLTYGEAESKIRNYTQVDYPQ